jgi:hypothetical protein
MANRPAPDTGVAPFQAQVGSATDAGRGAGISAVSVEGAAEVLVRRFPIAPGSGVFVTGGGWLPGVSCSFQAATTLLEQPEIQICNTESVSLFVSAPQ